jgi:PAS domain S-box-containing protein
VKRHWLLYVEDNDDDVKLVRELLPRSEFPVSAAASAEEAREKLRNTEFDLLLLDHNLPDTNSLLFLDEIRRQAPALKVIVLTGRSDEALEFAVRAKGAAEFLHKDDLARYLLPLVRESVAGAGEAPAPPRPSREESLYRSLLSVMTEGVLLVDVNGVVIFANDASGRMTEDESACLVGQRAADLFDPASRLLFEEWLRPFIAGDGTEAAQCEVRLRRGAEGGSDTRPVLVSGRSVRSEFGAHEACLVTLTDIAELVTTRERLQRRLSEMERFQRFFIEREKRIVELKAKIREYERRLGIEAAPLSDETLRKLNERLRPKGDQP